MTGLRDTQIAGKALFQVIFVRVFLEEMIGILISGLSREDLPSLWAGMIQLAEGLDRTKRERKDELRPPAPSPHRRPTSLSLSICSLSPGLS